jgi:hypothetical protein
MPPVHPAEVVEQLVSTFNGDSAAGPESAFAALLAAVYQRGYTGQIVLHFRGGVPQQADFPQPLRVKLST